MGLFSSGRRICFAGVPNWYLIQFESIFFEIEKIFIIRESKPGISIFEMPVSFD